MLHDNWTWPPSRQVDLSAGDARALRLLYPTIGAELGTVVDRSTAMLDTIEAAAKNDIGLEADSPNQAYAADAARVLRRRITDLSGSSTG